MNAKLETEIRELTDRFFEGTTTLEEERRLYDFFRQKDIPQDLEPYKDMFLDFSALTLSERKTGFLTSATPGTSGQAVRTLLITFWAYSGPTVVFVTTNTRVALRRATSFPTSSRAPCPI